MSPAEKLRERVVTSIVRAQIGLGFALYGLVGALLWERGTDGVPDALWLAAGAAAQAIYSFLSNSKGQDRADGEPVPVTVADEPVRVVDARDWSAPGDAGLVSVTLLVILLGALLFLTALAGAVSGQLVLLEVLGLAGGLVLVATGLGET